MNYISIKLFKIIKAQVRFGPRAVVGQCCLRGLSYFLSFFALIPKWGERNLYISTHAACSQHTSWKVLLQNTGATEIYGDSSLYFNAISFSPSEKHISILALYSLLPCLRTMTSSIWRDQGDALMSTKWPRTLHSKLWQKDSELTYPWDNIFKLYHC